MEESLVSFYMDCVLPEFVDSKKGSNMPIRDPEYIKEAMKNRKLQGSRKTAHQENKRTIIKYNKKK